MKRILFILLVLSAAACSRPRIIPDEQLAAIFRDAYLTNAYVSREQIDTDSLKLYEPVFDRYGYTAEDVYYTIGNFSRRKSARLSDVVERAIVLLDTEGARYDHEVAVLDTIDRVARRTATRTLRTDTLLRVERLRDTSLLHFALDSIRPGDYRVTFRYRIDSLDRNTSWRGDVWLERPGRPRPKRFNYTMRRSGSYENYQRTLTAGGEDRRLIFDFSGSNADQALRRPSITVRDLCITYTPPTELAVEEYYRQAAAVRIFADEFFRHAEKDSL